MSEWIKRWNDHIAAQPEMPGVWKRRDGGFRVRARATDPRTGRMVEVNRALPDCKRATKAASELEQALTKIRTSDRIATESGFPHFGDYAADLFERKVKTGKIASAAGAEKWRTILTKHLVPRFGDWFLDKITKRDIEAWKVALATEGYAPTTGNTMLAVLKTILAAAVEDHDGLTDPSLKVEPFETKAHRTYTAEQPNALKIEDVDRFLDAMLARWPEHYAMVYLGMWTGWRPSTLRPLRRRGANPDVNWETGVVAARRSHTIGDRTMAGTKNGDDNAVRLPPAAIEVLRWHCDRLDQANIERSKRSPDLAAAMAASELLFPAEPSGRSKGGGFRTKSSLRRAFKDCAKALGLSYEVTPRALRRSFQDLMREAEVNPIVARGVCGHRTAAMTTRYSTVSLAETQTAIAKVIDLAAARRARSPLGSPPERSELLAPATSPPTQTSATPSEASG